MKLFQLLLLLLFLSACEKDVDFKLQTATQKLVVDASIENGLPPKVVLTKTTRILSSTEHSSSHFKCSLLRQKTQAYRSPRNHAMKKNTATADLRNAFC